MLLYRFLRLQSTPRQRAEPLKNAQIRRHGCGFGGFRGRVHLIIVGFSTSVKLLSCDAAFS